MKLVVDILFGLVFVLSLGGLGVFITERFFKIKIDFISGFFVGSGIAIIILFICGMMGLFGTVFYTIFFVLIFLFSITGRRGLFRVELPLNFGYILPFLLLIIVLAMAGLGSLSPPIKNDTLFYHLGLPRLWSLDGGIEFYPWLSFSTTALNSEVLLTPIVGFVSAEAAQFFVFLTGVMLILLIARGAYKYLDSSPGQAILITGAVSFLVAGLPDAKNDYLAAGLAVMSFLWYADYLKHKDWKYILLSGLLAGLAASTKANSLIFALAMFLMLIISRHNYRHILIFAVSAFVLGAPWFIKSYLQTGNLFYPFFNEYFNSPIWHDLFTAFNKATGVDSEKQGILNFITSPVRLIYNPDIFRTRIGPMPLLLLPFLALLKNIPAIIKKALVISIIFYALWYIAWPMGRYLLPIIAILCLVAAYISQKLSERFRYSRYVIILGLSGLIALNGVLIFRDNAFRIKTTLGIVNREEFLKTATYLDPNALKSAEKEMALPYIDIWQYLNNSPEEDATVGILCSNWYRADGFYLNKRFIYLNPSNQTVVDFSQGIEAMSTAIVENNLRYILIDKVVIAEFSQGSKFADAPGFDVLSQGVADFVEITKQNGRLEYITDRFELYRVKNLSSILKAPFS